LRVHALGISPSMIISQSVLKNSTQAKKIFLSRSPSDGKGELIVSVHPTGEFAHYLRVSEQFIIPGSEDGAWFPFEIFPQDAPNGTYTAGIVFSLGAGVTQAKGTQVGVIPGVKAQVRFTVDGKQVVEYTVRNVSIADTEVGQPFQITYTVTNSGNVEWKPDRLELELVDQEDATHRVKATVVSDAIAPVKPGNDGQAVVVQSAAELSDGQYKATVRFYENNQVKNELKSNTFRVYPKGTLQQTGELISLQTNKGNYDVGEKIKLQAKFKNTGELPVTAVVYTEVNRDSKLLDVVRGDEQVIAKGHEAFLGKILTLDQSGTYHLLVYVKYANKQTDPQSVDIAIRSSGAGAVLVGLLVIVLVLLGLIYALLRWHKKQTRQSL